LAVDFRLYLVTDRRRAAGGDLPAAVGRALSGGVRAVQLREKDLPGRELYELAVVLRALTPRYGARLLVNDRIDVALAAGADGVHLGVASVPPFDARRLLGPEALIGCSTHDLRELAAAEEGGADFVTFGPVYATPSKAAHGPPVGIGALRRACAAARVPVFALGGVGPGNAGEALGAGAWGIGAIGAILGAPDPFAAARELAGRVRDGVAMKSTERSGKDGTS
jgi:thiamine-phosphate pyrophosphorylase